MVGRASRGVAHPLGRGAACRHSADDGWFVSNSTGAIRSYRTYLAIRADAEPRLQPEVQRVKAELAALEHASSAR